MKKSRWTLNVALREVIREDVALTVRREVQDIARAIQKEFDEFRLVLKGRIQPLPARCALVEDELEGVIDEWPTGLEEASNDEFIRKISTDLDDWAAECAKASGNCTDGPPKCGRALCEGKPLEFTEDAKSCTGNPHKSERALCVAPRHIKLEFSLDPAVPGTPTSSAPCALPSSALREANAWHMGVSARQLVPELSLTPSSLLPTTALRESTPSDSAISVAEQPASTVREPPNSVKPDDPIREPSVASGISQAEERLRKRLTRIEPQPDEASNVGDDVGSAKLRARVPQVEIQPDEASNPNDDVGGTTLNARLPRAGFDLDKASEAGDQPIQRLASTSDKMTRASTFSPRSIICSSHPIEACQIGSDLNLSLLSPQGAHMFIAGVNDLLSPQGANMSETAKAFQYAESGNLQQVQSFLDSHGDPNARLANFQGRKKLFTDCCLLPIAVIGESIDVVRLLMESRASPDSTYGFAAGALNIVWRGNALHAAASRGNVDMLRELVHRRGDVHAVSSNRANLLWQSCYHGHLSVLMYLLHHRVSHSIAAQSQDAENSCFTPLHISTLHGHIHLVEALLDAKADAKRINQQGHTPLVDAIICCLPEAVCLLISHGAKLVDCGRGDHTHTLGGGYRVLQNLFVERNPVLVQAAARGLLHQEEQTASLSTKHVLQFMRTGHSAAMQAIFKAIFRRREIFFRGENYEKIALRLAQLPAERSHQSVHTCESTYRFSDVTSWFAKRQAPEKEGWEFFDVLLPQRQPLFDWKRYQLTTVTVLESLVPDFHNDIEVMNAIASVSAFDPILETKQCRAIISCNWHALRHLYYLQLAAHASLLLIFFLYSILLREWCTGAGACPLNQDRHHTLRALALMGVPCVVYESIVEIMELVICAQYGWFAEYIQNLGNCLDVLRIVADYWVLFSVFIWSVQSSYYSRIVFASCCFYKWLKLLYQLTPIRELGKHVMPIIFAVRNIIPFLGVMLFYLGGMGHAYIALRFGKVHTLDGAIEIISFSLNQEHVPSQIFDADFKFDHAQYRITKLFVLLCIFMLPIALMNTFIAAMVESYTKGIENIERLYQSRVAHCVVTHLASRVCLRSLADKFRNSIAAVSDDDSSRPKSPSLPSSSSRPKYLWFCYERTKVAGGSEHPV